MLLLIIGIIICIIAWIISGNFIVFLLLASPMSMLLFAAEQIPTGKYLEWETLPNGFELKQLSDENANFIKKSETGITFRVLFKPLEKEILLNLCETHYRLIEIVESDEILLPYMTISLRYIKDSFVTFAKKPTHQTKYTFYVPTGTVIQENVVKEFDY